MAYNYLKIQGQRDYKNDRKALLMGGIDSLRKLNVLDIGCNDGEVTLCLMEEFKNEAYKFRYTGVEFHQDVVDKANAAHPGEDYMFIAGDVYDNEVLQKVKERGPFNVIVISQVIMHVENPVKLLELMKPLLSDEGFIYIKVVEDGMKMCHPGEDILKRIIELYQQYCDSTSRYTKGAHTDRFCGHKTYGYLVETGYEGIQHFIAHTDTVGKDRKERMEEFEQFAHFRLRDDMSDDMHKEMETLLDKMKSLFMQKSFYYSTDTMYFTVRNRSRGRVIPDGKL